MKVEYNISKKWNASANIQYENSKQGGYPYALFVDSTNTAKDINYDGVSFYNRQMLSSGLNLVYSANSFDLRLLTSHQRIDDEQGIDQDFTPRALFYVDQFQKQDMLAQEINIQSKDNEQYDWLFGVFAFNQLKDKEVTVNYEADAIKQYKLPFNEYYNTKWYDNSNTGLAFFHESTLKFGGFSATAGIRADYEVATLDYVYDVFTNGSQANVEKVISEMDFFEILPKVALKYNFSNHIAPYISVAKGYNSGGFNTSFEREEDRSFNPERSINYEAGVKAKWLEQRIYANLALFYIDWTNQQVYQTVPSGTGSMLTNAGKSESKGFEFELKAIPAKNLETNLTFGYNEARFIEYIKDNKTDYSGNFLPYVPKFTFNIGANYLLEMNKSWLDLIRINMNYSGIGKHYWHEDNLSYQSYYGLLNGRISFEYKTLTFSVWGKNMLNSDYNSFYFKALGNSYAQIGKPATFGVNLKLNF
jgi:outer membrane receptor protein involved in Fe transport